MLKKERYNVAPESASKTNKLARCHYHKSSSKRLAALEIKPLFYDVCKDIRFIFQCTKYTFLVLFFPQPPFYNLCRCVNVRISRACVASLKEPILQLQIYFGSSKRFLANRIKGRRSFSLNTRTVQRCMNDLK